MSSNCPACGQELLDWHEGGPAGISQRHIPERGFAQPGESACPICGGAVFQGSDGQYRAYGRAEIVAGMRDSWHEPSGLVLCYNQAGYSFIMDADPAPVWQPEYGRWQGRAIGKSYLHAEPDLAGKCLVLYREVPE